jgi:tetratricopeptide (TPR) repeat protein
MKSSEVQEILPWLKLATDMNPQYIKAYRVGGYWLRRLHKPAEARDFLFEGLHNNPGNIEILFDLGWLYKVDLNDPDRARNVWMAGLRCWVGAQSTNARSNPEAQLAYEETAMNLANLEESQGNWSQAIKYLQIVKPVSPNPGDIQRQIDEVEGKAAGDK